MILLVDIGNTRLKWAEWESGRMAVSRSARHNGHALQDVLTQHWLDLSPPERLVAANVAGEDRAAALASWTKERWNVVPEFVVACAEGYGVVNAYRDPERLGADRWAALVAARQRAEGPACVVDCGTAVTLDALGADGVHLGGLIVPGLNMMRQALTANTRGIPDEPEGQVSLLARDTRDAVTGGTLYTLVAVIDRVTEDVTVELGGRLERIITGGDAERVLPLLTGPYRHEPDLVLQGLAVMAEQAP